MVAWSKPDIPPFFSTRMIGVSIIRTIAITCMYDVVVPEHPIFSWHRRPPCWYRYRLEIVPSFPRLCRWAHLSAEPDVRLL